MQDIQNFEQFTREIANAVRNKMGEPYQVKLQNVMKNNQVNMLGLVIMSDDQSISPTIYLEYFWEQYKNGAALEELAERIVTVYREDVPKDTIDMQFFTDFEKVKDGICYRLINRETNQELLKQIPHKDYLDLAICYYYAYRNPEMGYGTILLYNSHLNLWNTTLEEVDALAVRNTPGILPWQNKSLHDMVEAIVGEFAEEDILPKGEDRKKMQVLSNNKNSHGASVILYKDALESMAEEMGGSYYILPSSVHEVILLKDCGGENEETLRDMISDVNRTQVPPEDVLSDTLYYYDFVEKEVRIV